VNIEAAIQAMRDGKLILVMDDADRENEGDLFLAAEKATPEKIAFMVRHTTGIVCVPMTEERLEQLRLPQMVAQNEDPRATAFTISVDARTGITTGVSAADRAHTARLLADPNVSPESFRRPGHLFPLRARTGGVLKRAGHTEAAVDLARLAGLSPVALLSEVVNEDGSMMRGPQLAKFAEEHDIPLITVADLIRYRRRREKLVEQVAEARIPTQWGSFVCRTYRSLLDGAEHVALTRGEIVCEEPVLVRVHSECLTGDVFSSRRCDCGEQLQQAMARIAEEERGVLVYLRGHEGRGVGLTHKLRAYGLQDSGCDTVEANIQLGLPVDSREYGIGAQILADLGIARIRLMTNNPIKYGGLEGYGLEIVERVPLTCLPNGENLRYLLAKQEKLGHLLNL
jgi:3,4-dihydroxy 2-butanone 4-phosphate synthase / GTP cyclohydrolase II